MPRTEEDLTLPKATIAKLIKEILPEDLKCSNETRDLLLECCVEFIHLISNESNEICARSQKKTIAPEHVLSALKELGFEEYVKEVAQVYDKHKAEEKPSMSKKLDRLGVSQEDLLREQQQLFAQAREAAGSADGAPSVAATPAGPMLPPAPLSRPAITPITPVPIPVPIPVPMPVPVPSAVGAVMPASAPPAPASNPVPAPVAVPAVAPSSAAAASVSSSPAPSSS